MSGSGPRHGPRSSRTARPDSSFTSRLWNTTPPENTRQTTSSARTTRTRCQKYYEPPYPLRRKTLCNQRQQYLRPANPPGIRSFLAGTDADLGCSATEAAFCGKQFEEKFSHPPGPTTPVFFAFGARPNAVASSPFQPTAPGMCADSHPESGGPAARWVTLNASTADAFDPAWHQPHRSAAQRRPDA